LPRRPSRRDLPTAAQPGPQLLGLKTPVGRLTGEQLLELAQLAERYGRGELRFTRCRTFLRRTCPTQLGHLIQEPLLKTLPYNPRRSRAAWLPAPAPTFATLP